MKYTPGLSDAQACINPEKEDPKAGGRNCQQIRKGRKEKVLESSF